MKAVNFGSETGHVYVYKDGPDNSYDNYELVRALVKNGYCFYIVTNIEPSGPFSTQYLFVRLSISRWRLIRKIQIWAIKKAFK